MLGTLGEHPLGAKDADAVSRALDLNPVASCMVSARVEAYGLSPRFLGGEMWSASRPADSLAFSGANLMPLIGSAVDLGIFAERALAGPRICSSIVGAADLAMPLWGLLGPVWGPPREIRDDQPLLALHGYPEISPDPNVRLVTMADLDVYFPAAVEMFIGEVGIDPCINDGGRSYRRRLAALISARRVFARFDGDRVIFKAEIGSMSRKVGQIQGVWVDPEWRGRGLGTIGTAAVVAAIARQGRTSSLYVNSFNHGARRTYAKVGFHQVGTFATVLVD
ncbi:GNAT family N-acetyltransferase [Gordonia sp. (in: high G+C Gram-positive bacteria)]|uniref:GNAT family N-acetyltransferase n=1 Tax=Gordonia sp. (in: high G+C Gram-positive bacteria) TaxID=84139 RepID=UPI003C76F856